MDGPGRSLQWAGECLPLQEKQSRWPGLLEELLKVFVGDKRDNELPPGSPGLFPNVIPWLCNLHPNTTEGILEEEVENAVTPLVEFLGNGKQQKQQEQSWKQAPAGSSRWVCAAGSTKEIGPGVRVGSPVGLGRDAGHEIPGMFPLLE
ncbi:uncharacterized protein ACIQIH_008528 isoform 1-T2 [Cyanocitta cristata]